MKNLQKYLSNIYDKYNKQEYIKTDPLLFVYRYSHWKDREIAGLIASALAFGKVMSINKKVEEILTPLGPSPAHFLQDATHKGLAEKYGTFNHRWIQSTEMIGLLSSIGCVLKKYGSLRECFENYAHAHNGERVRILSALAGFVDELESQDAPKRILPDPLGGSACKRLFLFLRWMVRKDTVDPGCWKGVIPESELMIPLDTHIAQKAFELGITGKKSTRSFRDATTITNAFRRIAPEDPVKFDFALSRQGMGH